MLKLPMDTLPRDHSLFQSTNRWAIDEYQRNMAQYYRGNTLADYSRYLIKFLEFCGKPYSSITSQDIKQFMSHNFGLGMKKTTVARYLASIKSFMRYLLESCLISCNPADKIRHPKIEGKLPISLSEEDFLKLMGAADNHLRDRAIIMLLYCTGVRVGEVVNIELSDIDWKKHKILIRKAKSNKQRIVFFSEICGQMLLAYLVSRHVACKSLFLSKNSKGMAISGFQRRIKLYVRKAGLNSQISIRWFRRTFAQQLVNKGMEDQDVAELLGHSSTHYLKIYSTHSLKIRKIKYDEFSQVT
ncbi:tyrosine-type recombinase/integrase [Desulfosporosinus fructosivorans]